MTHRIVLLAPLGLMLAACMPADPRPAARPPAPTPMVSPEAQTAFERTRRNLGYEDARMVYDDRRCVRLDGVDGTGRRVQSPLLDDDGERICIE